MSERVMIGVPRVFAVDHEPPRARPHPTYDPGGRHIDWSVDAIESVLAA